MTDATVRALVADLASPDANKRFDAALKLGYPGCTLAIPELMRLAVSEPVHKVRIAAISSLGRIGDRAAYGLLESLWKNSSENQHVRAEALKACDRMDGLDPDDVGEPDNQSGGGSGGDGLGGI
jgi:HEAT repeat protein